MASKDTIKVMGLSLGVVASFTIFGYAQEAVTRTEFGAEKERFNGVGFLIVVQCLGNALIAAILLLAQGKSLSGGVPLKEQAVVAAGCFGAHTLGLTSLRYIPFPLQVVCKSCKSVPVMIGESLLAKKQHSLEKKIQVILLCIGVVTFTLAKGSSKGDSALSAETLYGLVLVVLALICDGIYGPYQNIISKEYKPSALNLMFNLNFGEGLIAIAYTLIEGSAGTALAFITKHSVEFIPLLVQFSVAMAVGNLFLFKLQADFGALTVTITTTVRKMVSVIFSVVLFGHVLLPAQWIAAGIVFLSTPISKRIAPLLHSKKDDEKKAK